MSSKISDLLVSVIIPIATPYSAFTIESVEGAQKILSECYANYEIIVVDANLPRPDNPFNDLLNDIPNVRYYRISSGSDLEICMTAGLENAIGDVVVIFDPEEDPWSLIPEFVSTVAKHGTLAIGLNSTMHEYSTSYAVLRQIYYRVLRHLIPERHPANSTFFVGLSRQAVNSLLCIKYKSRFMRVFTSSLGMPTKYVEYSQRPNSRKQKSLLTTIACSTDTLVMNTTKPLRYSAYLGLFAACFNLLYIGYIFLVNLFKAKVAEGWTTNSLQNSLMFFFMFLMLTVLSEYIDRLFNETKDRPLYFVYEETNSAVRLNVEPYVNVVRDSH